jgi:(p)ppGpp synthase/HD superfamily hydrolase
MMYQALKFAAEAHTGQARKYTGESYINHPIAVAKVLTHLYPEATDGMIIAAILHDTVEDTVVTIEQVQAEFGSEVATLVGWLTDVSVESDGNREARKRIDREHTEGAPFEAQIVKLADLIDNTKSIVQYDRGFAKVYLREKSLILASMRSDVKSTRIWREASALLSISKNHLGLKF